MVKNNFERYSARRFDLIKRIKDTYPDKKGIVLLFASFETGQHQFQQNSTFYYYTGLGEPGLVLSIDLQGKTTLWTPTYKGNRKDWLHNDLDLIPSNASLINVDSIEVLGEPIAGFEIRSYTPMDHYNHLLSMIKSHIDKNEFCFVSYPKNFVSFVDQRFMIDRLEKELGNKFIEQVVDVSPSVTAMRQHKDSSEIEQLYKAIDITCMAQEVAARTIAPDVNEAEVQARIEYIYTVSQATIAFATIVAGGKNSTTLHYHQNSQPLKSGDLVVVDTGAQFNHYCGDITRTYPVSGTFTKRQKEIYNLVLETQEYVTSLAQPGYWLSNKEHPDKSLNHLTHKYLDDKGYGKYFIHGVGHYLGLDTHDVGDYTQPLKEGDVFTIEPGIYIPEENLGVRIEDNYWMTKSGLICLSDQLPKGATEVEMMAQQTFNENDQEEEKLSK